MALDIPYSINPDCFVKSGVNSHIGSCYLLTANFWVSLSAQGTCILKSTVWICLRILICVFPDHHLYDGKTVLLSTLLCKSHSTEPRLASKRVRYTGRRKEARQVHFPYCLEAGQEKSVLTAD